MKDIYSVDGPRMVKIMFVNKSSISFTEARTSRNKIFLLSMVGYDINSTNIVRPRNNAQPKTKCVSSACQSCLVAAFLANREYEYLDTIYLNPKNREDNTLCPTPPLSFNAGPDDEKCCAL